MDGKKGHQEVYRGAEYKVDLVPKVKLELFVRSPLLEPAISAITSAAATGKIGDGKIFVSGISEVIRIRNGDRGELVI